MASSVPVVLVTDRLTRSEMTTTYHLQISGGTLSVVVVAERRYSTCRLSDDNNNNDNNHKFNKVMTRDEVSIILATDVHQY